MLMLGAVSTSGAVTSCARSSGEAGFVTVTSLTGDASVVSNADASVVVVVKPPSNGDGSTVVGLDNGDGASQFAGDGGLVSLRFMPPSAVLTLDGTGPKTASFTLLATDVQGDVVTVQPEAIEFDRPDLATITDSNPITATAPATPSPTPYGGTGQIHAIYLGVEATATVTVQVNLAQFAAGLSATSPSVVALGAAGLPSDPASNINPILYPYDGTVWPLGLTAPLTMWNAPQAGDVYRLHYAEKNFTVDFYTTLAAPPAQVRLDQATWDRMTNSNGTLYGSTDPVTFSLSRWDNTAQKAYATATETWTIAPESLRGAIYYWSASEVNGVRVGHITKLQPGLGAAPQVLNNGICMGCHAVNAQGTMLVGDVDDGLEGTRAPDAGVPSVAPYANWSGTRPWASFDITQPTSPLIYQSNKFGADVALTPDAKYVVFGGPSSPTQPGSKYISLGDPRTGSVVANSGLDNVMLASGATQVEMPAFSPDGTKLAVVEATEGGGNVGDNVIPGPPETIAYLDFDETGATGPTFGATPHTIVAATSSAFTTTGSGLAYPSFTPDSLAVAYHAGTTATGCVGTCDDTSPDDGNLFVSLLSGGSPIRLVGADDPPNVADHNASVEPTFNPITRGGYSWAVFTSMRAWGNQPWPASVTAAGHVNGKRRLWVTALDTTIGTSDPSHPPFYLEGQEDTPNMRGFWTLAPCIATPTPNASDAGAPNANASGGDGGAAMCTNGFECCSGFCENGMCVTPNQLTCVGLGGACTMDSDCCNTPIVQCISGICQIPHPH
jgi:hypothetical protein